MIANSNTLNFSMCFADPKIVLQALNISPTDKCLSVGGAGDMALAMLAKNPRKVYVIEDNFAQYALIELKIAAFKRLSYPELISFFGSKKTTSTKRFSYYQKLQNELSRQVVTYWNNNLDIIKNGVFNYGQLEDYLKVFRKKILPLTGNDKLLDTFLLQSTKEKRQDYYYTKWHNLKWRFFIKIFTSTFYLKYFFKNKNLFKYRIKGHTNNLNIHLEKLLATEDIKSNPFLNWLFFAEHKFVLPFILQEENYKKIKENIGNIKLYNKSLQDYLNRKEAKEKLDCFYFGFAFEHMDFYTYCETLERLSNYGKAGSRLAYFNFMTPRSRPLKIQYKIYENPNHAYELLNKAQINFFDKFVVESII